MNRARSTVILAAVLLASSATAAPPDDARATAAGIRKLSGKHLTLYTDLSGPEIDRLPEIFDQAFPQWCRYFKVKESDRADWHLTGCLMKDRNRFIRAGLLPESLPPFKHGYSQGTRLWLNEQPSDFYRRELFLHEGAHGFMHTVLRGSGPPWYSEGMAEYLGTHRWRDGRLTLGAMPQSRDEASEWGRIGIIQKAVAEHRALPLGAVIDFPATAHSETEPYAWCWAAVTLLDRHPRYQDRFRKLAAFVRQPDFNDRFRRFFRDDWQELCEEWQLMTANLEYGYDVARSAVDFSPATLSPLPMGEGSGVMAGVSGTSPVTVLADRGWQNSGLHLEGGKKYRLTASGRYQIAQDSPLSLGEGLGVGPIADSTKPSVWWCEPGGVSIRYYQGRPLGIVLAGVRPDHSKPGGECALLHPTVIGLGATLVPKDSGTLFLKINDSAAERDDNAGGLKVDVRRE